MIELRQKIDEAIIITEEGKPHRINIPLLKQALKELAGALVDIDIKIDQLASKLPIDKLYE